MELTRICSHTSKLILSQTAKLERENFKLRLDEWERAVPGENRGPAAKLALAAYDQSENGSLYVVLDLSGQPITDCPPLPPKLLRFNISNTQISSLPENLKLDLLNISNTPLEVLFLSEFDEPEEFTITEQQWDSHVNDVFQNNVKKNLELYNAQGGIREVFENQKPDSEQVDKINIFISSNLVELASNDGVKLGEFFVNFPQKRDNIELIDFETAFNMEWCLFLQGGKSYILITAATADKLLALGSRHPFIQRPLEVYDIIRGKAVLDLIK